MPGWARVKDTMRTARQAEINFGPILIFNQDFREPE
jgi:hypothetical protein